MEKKSKKFWQGFLAGVLTVAVFCGLTYFFASGGLSLILGTSGEEGALDAAHLAEKISDIEELIGEDFLYDWDEEQLEDGLFSGMLAGLEEPYSTYYSEEEYEQVKKSQAGSYCGIGATVSQDPETGEMTILEISPLSPAETAGLEPGDVLYMVDGTEITGMDLGEVSSEYISGEEGTAVEITVLRDGETLTFTVLRGRIETQTVSYELLDGAIGYIKVSGFDKETANQFVEAVEELEAQGMEKLLLDLRDNPGGILNSAVDIAAYLLPDDQYDGTLLYTENKEGKGERYYSQDGMILYESHTDRTNDHYPREDGHQLDLPMVVLINENSASAAEILTGCLKDYGWATIVGTNSFGKGIVQVTFPLEDGSAVKLTNSQYFTPSGYALHGKGITPDLVVEQGEEGDAQLEEGLAVLENWEE